MSQSFEFWAIILSTLIALLALIRDIVDFKIPLPNQTPPWLKKIIKDRITLYALSFTALAISIGILVSQNRAFQETINQQTKDIVSNNIALTERAVEIEIISSALVDRNADLTLAKATQTSQASTVEAFSEILDMSFVELTRSANEYTDLMASLPPTPTPLPQKIIFIQYTVMESDTIASIANRADTSVELLEEMGISQASLVPGTNIGLPVVNPLYCSPLHFHLVTSGETLGYIAQSHNTTIDVIMALNALNSNNLIHIGDVLCIP